MTVTHLCSCAAPCLSCSSFASSLVAWVENALCDMSRKVGSVLSAARRARTTTCRRVPAGNTYSVNRIRGAYDELSSAGVASFVFYCPGNARVGAATNPSTTDILQYWPGHAYFTRSRARCIHGGDGSPPRQPISATPIPTRTRGASAYARESPRGRATTQRAHEFHWYVHSIAMPMLLICMSLQGGGCCNHT